MYLFINKRQWTLQINVPNFNNRFHIILIKINDFEIHPIYILSSKSIYNDMQKFLIFTIRLHLIRCTLDEAYIAGS